MTTKIMLFYASHIIAKNVTMERVKKVALKITMRAKNIKTTESTKIMLNYAQQNISVKNVKKNSMIELGYGDTKRNV